MGVAIVATPIFASEHVVDTQASAEIQVLKSNQKEYLA